MAGHQALLLVTAVLLAHHSKPTASTTDSSNFCYTDPSCGPFTWGGICQSGTHQSPVNILLGQTDIFPGHELSLSACHSRKHDFLLTNDGHLVRMELLNVNQKSKCIASGNLFGNSKYEFAKVEFHWGSDNTSGSEHTVNGKGYPLEMQLFYRKTQYKSFAAAVDSGNPGAVTVLQFYGKLSSVDNPAFAPICNKLGEVTPVGTSTIGTGVVLAIFAPRYCAYATAVARYDGSMTTPGCQETVLWHSFLDAIDISQNQLEQFRALLDTQGNLMAGNHRQTQPLNDRRISFVSVSCKHESA